MGTMTKSTPQPTPPSGSSAIGRPTPGPKPQASAPQQQGTQQGTPQDAPHAEQQAEPQTEPQTEPQAEPSAGAVPQDAPQATATQQAAAPQAAAAQAAAPSALSQLWANRPERIPKAPGESGIRLGGVCEGIGVRYQVDPTLLRVFFVFGAICGLGTVPIYLIAWGVLTRRGAPTSPFSATVFSTYAHHPAYKHERRVGWTLYIVLLVDLLFSLTTGFWILGFPSFGVFAVLALAGWLLFHTHTPQEVPMTTPPTPGQPERPAGEPTVSLHDAPSPTASTTASGAAGTGGAARVSDTATTSGISDAQGAQPAPALSAQPAAFDTTSFDAAPFSAAEARAQAAAWQLPPEGIPATGMVPAGVAYAQPAPRPRRVWPWVVGTLAALTASVIFGLCVAGAVLWAAVNVYDSWGTDESLLASPYSWAPATSADLAESYRTGTNPKTLDLTNLKKLPSDRTVDLTARAGELNVALPSSIPVRINCFGPEGGGTCTNHTYNPDAGGATLTLNVSSYMGPITFTEATPAH